MYIVQPGGYFGWHQHSGLSWIVVTQGTLTFYDADDPSCTGHPVTAGSDFFDPGDHTHNARNETDPVVENSSSVCCRRVAQHELSLHQARRTAPLDAAGQTVMAGQTVVAGMQRTGSGSSIAIAPFIAAFALALILIGSLVWVRSWRGG